MTALWLSRVNSGIPVYAITDSKKAAQLMALYRDVHPIYVSGKTKSLEEMIDYARDNLIKSGLIKTGDTVLLTTGNHIHQVGGTNTMKIVKW